METTKLNKQEAMGIVPETAAKVKYQACIFGLDDQGKRVVSETRDVLAASTADAYKWAIDRTPLSDVIVHPIASAEDGESVDRLARHIQRAYVRWQIRNNNALFQGLDGREEEEQIQIAALAIWEGLTSGNYNNMHDLYRIGVNAICKARDRLYRVAEVTYDPQRLPHPFSDMAPKATCPDLCTLVHNAYSATTETQREVIDMYMNGISPTDISDRTGRNRRNVYQLMYKGLCNILERMTEIDRDFREFEKSGINKEDVLSALETFRKRARR